MQLQSVQRVAALLRLLAANNRTGLRLVDCLRAIDMERSTCHRLLQSLISERMVMQDKDSKRYFLGMAIYEMGVAVPALHLRDICQPYLASVAARTGDTAFLTVRSQFDGVCIDRKEGSFPIAYVQEAGRRRPLTVGAGNLAILSALDDEEIARICEENRERVQKKYPLYTQDRVLRRIAHGKRLGYVFTDVLERTGIKAMGVPVRDSRGKPLAAISLSALNTRWTDRKLTEVIDILKETTAAFEEELARSALPFGVF